jgi:hypothetical protein
VLLVLLLLVVLLLEVVRNLQAHAQHRTQASQLVSSCNILINQLHVLATP